MRDLGVALLVIGAVAACGSVASGRAPATQALREPAGAAATATAAAAEPDHAALARAVAREVDRLRADPRGYAAHLRALGPRYDGKLLRLDGRDPIRTREGRRPLDQAVRRLGRARPLGPLRWEPGLARAAADHVADLGRRGVVDHYGARGDSPLDRVARHGVLQGVGGENIAVGFDDPRMVVVYLLIDDGVADRGHREALLDRRYAQIGVACGPHARYRVVCVMDLAAGYASLVR